MYFGKLVVYHLVVQTLPDHMASFLLQCIIGQTTDRPK